MHLSRKGRCYICDKGGHYARECPDRRDSHQDDDQNPSHGNQRNGKSNSRNQGRGQPFKKARNLDVLHVEASFKRETTILLNRMA